MVETAATTQNSQTKTHLFRNTLSYQVKDLIQLIQINCKALTNYKDIIEHKL